MATSWTLVDAEELLSSVPCGAVEWIPLASAAEGCLLAGFGATGACVIDRMERSSCGLSICPNGVFRTVWGSEVI